MEAGDKIICKKDICLKVGRWHIIYFEDEVCEIRGVSDLRNNPIILTGKDGEPDLILNSCTIIIDKLYLDRKDFSEFFYTPDETKNILRTKTIDKMLKK
jgi:hypothetical protein